MGTRRMTRFRSGMAVVGVNGRATRVRYRYTVTIITDGSGVVGGRWSDPRLAAVWAQLPGRTSGRCDHSALYVYDEEG